MSQQTRNDIFWLAAFTYIPISAYLINRNEFWSAAFFATFLLFSLFLHVVEFELEEDDG